jgi:metal-responsive CopG/Arc/MetJ family transcriptional regulator
MARIALSISEELLKKIDDEWIGKGLPSRNSFIVQILRNYFGMSSFFDDKGSQGQ